MADLQLRLTPADARLVLALLESPYGAGLTADQLDRAAALAPYLRHRIARLWSASELPAYRETLERAGATILYDKLPLVPDQQ